MSTGDVVLLAVAAGFAVFGIAWLVRTVRVLRRKGDRAPRALWLLVVERAAAWLVVALAFVFGALGSASVGHWLFLGACVLLVVETIAWRALLPRLAADFDEVMR
ncbi:MAG TPA: hypothetical protein VLD13_03500 [Gaiellaceae bacterium]|nr:hypothetical protein [Gaiellaceae bacterium]